MQTVEAYAHLGPDHLTGTTNETQTQQWFIQQLTAAGVPTGSQAYSFLGFRPQQVALTAAGVAVPPTAAAAYFYSGVTGPTGLSAPLVDVGYGTPVEVQQNKVKGKIAVVEVPQLDGINGTFARAFSTVQSAGAAAMVAVTDGPDDFPVNQDVDSRLGLQHLPTVLVGHRSGAAVLAAAKANRRATLTLTADVGPACDTDVWGVLPGANPDRYVVVGTPTSGFDPAASERGAGVAVVLGLARHYAALPQSKRPVGLVFAGLSGHEVGYLGLPVLMEAHPDWFNMADAYVHLGASIAALSPSGNGGDPTRALYVSENPPLEAAVHAAFITAQPLGSIPPSVTDPGEQSQAYAADIPIVGESGSSTYFHTAGDTPAGVGPSLLAGQASSFAAAIDRIASLPAGTVRAANQVADEGAALHPASTTPGGSSAGSSAAGSVSSQPTPVVSCADPTPVQPAPTAPYTFDPTALALGLGSVAGYEAATPAYAWEGNWQERTVTWKSSLTGAPLYGTVFAPNPPPTTPVPGVVIVPGSGPGTQSFYQWAARDLAGHGYEALAVDPQGVGRSGTFGDPPCSAGSPAAGQATMCPGVPFQQDPNYVDAAKSGVDFLVSAANPYRPQLDAAEIGLAGHSLGARAVSWLQGADARVKAVAAWDNLASDLNGDAGSPSGGPPASEIIGGGLPGAAPQPATPRVPALGEASDSQGFQTTNGPEIKKTAYDAWRRAGVPSMEVVYAGAQHADWAETPLNSASDETSLVRFEFYTRAWFDLFLRDDPSAVARLTATNIDGTARRQFMSTKFHSALFLPAQGIDCANLAATTCP